MTRFQFVSPADVTTFARIALEGPGGGGKTWTALTLARALGPNTGLIDTERNKAAKYRRHFSFKHLPMHTYSPADLTEAISDAAEQGIDPLVVDSMSLFWDGTDGMLEQVDRATAAAGRQDKFGSGWNTMRPVERGMLDALLSYPGHVIVTMRTKNEYALETDSRGKTGPVKIGLKPIQREGMDYEFDIVATMHKSTMTVTKSNCVELTDAVIEKPTEDVGYKILEWLESPALPEHLSPIRIRDWAVDPARTIDELAERLDEVTEANLAGAAVRSPSGRVGALGDFLVMCQRRIRERRGPSLANAAAEAAAARPVSGAPTGQREPWDAAA